MYVRGIQKIGWNSEVNVILTKHELGKSWFGWNVVLGEK